VANHWWIVLWGALGLMIARMIARMIAQRIAGSRSGLDKKEMAVVRGAAAEVRRDEAIDRDLEVYSFLGALRLPGQSIRYYKHRAAAKKLVPFNPRELNRAQGVIFSFQELRLTRTELIRGYEENAQRIPLRGLTATVVTGQTVQIRIEGPDTKFVYRNAFDAKFNQTRALQFAALLNYEASLLGASP
jgi:hypothetical protein